MIDIDSREYRTQPIEDRKALVVWTSTKSGWLYVGSLREGVIAMLLAAAPDLTGDHVKFQMAICQ